MTLGRGFFLNLTYELVFKLAGVRNHFAGGDFLVRGPLKTEFAHTDAVFGAHRRTEYAASHWARLVKFAEPGVRVENWTRLTIPELGELFLGFGVLIEHSGDRITRKISGQAADGSACAAAHIGRALRVNFPESSESLTKTGGIKLINRECPYAALGTAWPTRQPFAAPATGLGESRVHDLNQFSIAARQKHALSIARTGPKPVIAGEESARVQGMLIPDSANANRVFLSITYSYCREGPPETFLNGLGSAG